MLLLPEGADVRCRNVKWILLSPPDSMDPALSKPEIRRQLQTIYLARFSGMEGYRNEVWKVLVSNFFSQWVKPDDVVLDLGCGYCEFINNVNAREKFGMDLNPAAKDRISPDIRLFEQDCSEAWALRANSLDVVFTSNFFEHLPTKAALQATLLEAYRCLRPGGRLIAMGPNVKFLSGRYWDFFDHHISLTELSLGEALTMSGFTIERAIPKFLPYTMSHKLRPPIWALRAYLKMPPAWSIFGRQFLVVAQK
jgi:SAM-dependent methyltransferase